jgi:hypothetical protein
LDKVLSHVRNHHLLPQLSAQLCFVHGQYAHLLGFTEAAVRYYQACQALISPESELALSAEICLLGAQGRMKDVKADEVLLKRVIALGERCRGSGNAGLVCVGLLLASFTSESNLTSK